MRRITRGDREYPDLLRSIKDPPAFLHVWGALDPEACPVAIVGSRRPSAYGRRAARALAKDAAAQGAVVVSGLARGIDTEAHEGSLEARGRTWAVLGSGLDRLYPPENVRLARRIVEGGGAVVSELPREAPPLPYHFPRRNRIVSGLCWATVVVEGSLKSGSLITAKAALEQGREVLAVPGPVDAPTSEAPLKLLRDGARPADSFESVRGCLPLEGVGVLPSIKEAPLGPLPLGHLKILECLGSEALGLDDLARRTSMTIPVLCQAMFELELQDLVGREPGQRYAKKERARRVESGQARA